MLPDVAIAALNQVRSILLVSQRPMEEIRTVAVDTSSRTSVGLPQVLLTKFYGGRRELRRWLRCWGRCWRSCDAGLLIGDPAMMAETDGLHAYDLAELWRAKTGLPFVFAVWTVRQGGAGGDARRDWSWAGSSGARATTGCGRKTWRRLRGSGRRGWD